MLGHVAFKQQNTFLYCDSAYFYNDSDYVEAYSHVHIVQGDTVNIYSDRMNYDGDRKLADLFKHVKMTDKTMTMTTEILHYDLNTDVAHYPDHAKIIDSENTLTSLEGYYYSEFKEFFFRKDVVLVNPQYTMKSDTLKYNTNNKTAYFFGPTNITSKENHIYCEDGRYNTETDESTFYKNSWIQSKEQRLKGDSLWYNRKEGIGKAYRNIQIKDTVQKILITGHYAEYHELNQISWVTDSALMIQIFKNDSLFLHADTLKSVYDSVCQIRSMFAYHHTRFFKPDLSGSCDSLYYSTEDSMMRMYYTPVIWSKENQLTADTIFIQMSNSHIERLELYRSSFIISQEDTFRFNQVKGKNMTGYFVNDTLNSIKVEGNGQSVYYAKDKDNKYVGVNRSDCSDMMILLKDNKVSMISLITSPDATFYPISELTPNELKLKDFNWLIKKEPLKMEDVFRE